jgi:hypothetical protein
LLLLRKEEIRLGPLEKAAPQLGIGGPISTSVVSTPIKRSLLVQSSKWRGSYSIAETRWYVLAMLRIKNRSALTRMAESPSSGVYLEGMRTWRTNSKSSKAKGSEDEPSE